MNRFLGSGDVFITVGVILKFRGDALKGLAFESKYTNEHVEL